MYRPLLQTSISNRESEHVHVRGVGSRLGHLELLESLVLGVAVPVLLLQLQLDLPEPPLRRVRGKANACGGEA